MAETNATAQPTTPPPANSATPEGPKADAPSSETKKSEGAPQNVAKDKLKQLLGSATQSLAGLKEQGLLKVKGILLTLVKSPISLVKYIVTGDLASKFLILAFLMSVGLFLYSGSLLFQRFGAKLSSGKDIKEENATATGISALAQAHRELSIAYNSLVFMERFSANLTSKSNRVVAFEVELFLECDKPDTARAIKSEIEVYKEVVATSIQGQTLEGFAADPEKTELREKIRSALNHTIKKRGFQGNIKRVFFTSFKIN
ncbi:MAG: flagellar basal body-associated FliL family protein [Bacteriovoracia bacterium]